MTFIVLIAACLWGFDYISDERATAFSSGVYNNVHNGVHRTFTAGTPDFDKQMTLLLFCEYLMVGFIIVTIIGSFINLRKALSSKESP